MVPRFPGPLGGLIQSHVREFLCMLDVYFAATLSFGGLVYRLLAAHPDPSAPLVLGQLTVILLSTLAQCPWLFEVNDGRMRARLLPLSGIAILLAHDIAWFILVLALAWPYPILPSIAACCMALAVGHHAAVDPPLEQRRWRFAQGRVAPTGILQILALVSAGVAVNQFGWRILPLFVAMLCGLVMVVRQSLEQTIMLAKLRGTPLPCRSLQRAPRSRAIRA